MKPIGAAAVVVVLLTAVPAFSLAQSSATTTPRGDATSKASSTAQAKSAKPTMHATKGVVRSIDEDKLVIARSLQHGREMTFLLNPSTERSGEIKVGSTVGVRYHTESDQRVATAVTVEHAKQH
jgi:hypothetical protein